MEEAVFSIEEADSQNRARQTLFIRKLDEAIRLRFRLFQYHDYCVILDPFFLYKKVERSSFGNSMKTKERVKFLADCRSINTQTIPKINQILTILVKNKIPLESVFGTEIEGLRFHYINDPSHFRHCMGLADAVDLAMTNMSVTVKFPGRCIRTINPSTPPRKRLYSRLGKKKFTYSMCRLTTKHRLYHLLLHFLRSIPKKEKEKDYVKLIKTTLAYKFSQEMEQDLPLGEIFPLFPSVTQKKLDSIFSHNKKLRVQFYFNLLQSKALCAPVGKDMIEEAYNSHRRSLCRPVEEISPVPEIHLRGLREYGKKVGRRVSELYDPFVTRLPNTRACIERGRHLGGNLSQLQDQGRLVCYQNNALNALDSSIRLEPFVVGLFGPPGSGKTTLVQNLVRHLGINLFSDLSRDKLVYSRSCSTEHWDGYTGQPIVILDDFGQNHASRLDIVEFENIVSVNDYVLPMAELSEKGQKFISPIIILTSNCKYGSNLIANQSTFVEEPWAVWRRITLPLLIERGQPIRKYEHRPTVNDNHSWKLKHNLACVQPGTYQWSAAIGCCTTQDIPTKLYHNCPNALAKDILRQLRERFSYHQMNIQDIWVQKIAQSRIECEKSEVEDLVWDVYVNDIDFPCSNKDWTKELQFPASPPSTPPIVKAVALSEPLKVRMITAAESDCKVLQPFQQALWKYLSEQPQFCLTNGVKAPWSEHETFADDTLPWIYRIETMIKEIRDRGNPETAFWLSGDYTAATDNFPMSVTNALIEGILSEIDHKPTREWVLWEVSSHEIRYPGGKSGIQTSGQLMGSLLSFPLLCFLNDYIVSYSGFDQFSYLINGDDVVAYGEENKIQTWREQAPLVGLSLSLGKNFIDRDFCTVNSQLFFQGEVLHTGKVSCQTRVGSSLGYCFEETQFYWGSEDWVKYEFLKRNLLELRKTPRSLHVSKSKGGLALSDTFVDTKIKYDMGLLKRIYIFDLLKKFNSSELLPGTNIRAVPVPVLRGLSCKHQPLVGKDMMNRLRAFLPPNNEGEIKELTHSDLNGFFKKVNSDFPKITVDKIQRLITQGKYHLKNFPPLDFIEIEYLFVQNGKSRFILERARDLCLDLLFRSITQPNVDPYDFIGGDLSDLDLSQEWDKIKEIFVDKNLLMEGSSDLCDLDLTQDVAEWYDDIDQDVELKGFKGYLPLPYDSSPIIDFLSSFSFENIIETKILK